MIESCIRAIERSDVICHNNGYNTDGFSLIDLFECSIACQAYEAEKLLAGSSVLLGMLATLGEKSDYLEAGISDIHRVSLGRLGDLINGRK